MSDPGNQYPIVGEYPSAQFESVDEDEFNGIPRPPLAVNPKPQWPFVDARLPSTLPWLANQPTASAPIDYPPADDSWKSRYGGMFLRGPVERDNGQRPSTIPFGPKQSVMQTSPVPLPSLAMPAKSETKSRYEQNLRDLGINPNNFYDLPAPLRDYIRSIMNSDSFKSVAEPIYRDDVQLKKETGGILDYLSASGDDDRVFHWQNRIVPYAGVPEKNPSPQSTAGMDAPAPDESVGTPVFEWHPHPITQPGGNLPSEADLARSLKYKLPGAIWYNDGSGQPVQVIYLAHPR